MKEIIAHEMRGSSERREARFQLLSTMATKNKTINGGQTKCLVRDCKNISKQDKHVSFHEFPSQQTLGEKWLNNLKDHLPLGFSGVKTSTRICGAHFPSNMFTDSRKVRKLKPDAVPMLFVEIGEPVEKKIKFTGNA